MNASLEELGRFRRRIEEEWRGNIVPFWSKVAPDEAGGGFHGWISSDGRIDARADKGVILNARILWTFSHALRVHREDAFRAVAERAYHYFIRHFLDPEEGGVFWTVDPQGRPSEAKKRVYAQAFAIFALSEYFQATGVKAALDRAFEIFHRLEDRCRDPRNDGYFETFERDWTLAQDQRLSEVDQDEKKSMNTHLHVLEAFAALFRASSDARVKERLHALIEIFLARIVHPRTGHMHKFFDEEWTSRSVHVSFGHDVEASWLLCEAEESLDAARGHSRVKTVALQMAQAVYEKGLDADGGLFYEADAERVTDDDKHSWAQAEAVVGFVNAWQLSGSRHFLEAALRTWEFIDRHIVDRENGEWFWKVSRAGAPALDRPKLSQWKCPYHNSRMWFEINRRLAPAGGH